MVEVLSPTSTSKPMFDAFSPPSTNHRHRKHRNLKAPAADAIITIDVAYDGPDLFPATFFGISDTELVQAHTSQRWRGTDGLRSRFRLPRTDRAPVLPWSSLPDDRTASNGSPRARWPRAGMSAIYPTSRLVGGT